MQLRSLLSLTGALPVAVALAACAGGGASETHAVAAIPAGVQQAQPLSGAATVRRPASIPTCSGIGSESFLGGGTSNVAHGLASAVVAGSGNQVCDDDGVIAGGVDNAISSSSDEAKHSFVGAGQSNGITDSVLNGFIGAGVFNLLSATAEDSVIAGGAFNAVSVTYGVIGGGYSNTVSAEYAVIGGGEVNKVSGEGGYVAAGGYNNVSGEGAVIDGGFNNAAAGTFATIPGGYVNSAAGTYSFAAGARASAAQNGTFVWSDGSNGDAILTSSQAYQFLARASGGVTFWTNPAATIGATLAPGSGTWASASDRTMKTNVAGIDDTTVLDKVASLPISTWSYKTEHGVRHVGPMAQDFYAAFKVGEDDKHITSIDEDGVALAAIKALHAENAQLVVQQRNLRNRLAAMTALQSQQAREQAATRQEVERLSTALASLRDR